MGSVRETLNFVIDANTKQMAAGLQAGRGALEELSNSLGQTKRAADALNGQNVGVKVSTNIDQSTLLLMRGRLEAQIRGIENDLKINPDVDVAKASRQLSTLDRQIKALDRRIKVQVDTDGDMVSAGRAANALMTAFEGLSTAGMSVGKAGPYAAGGLLAVGAAAAAVAGPGMIGAVTAAIIGGGGYSLLNAYDQLNKQNRRAEIVFGDNLSSVRDWAKGISLMVGQGSNDIANAAAGIQDVLVPQGFKRDEAAGITKLLYERGAALAEWRGVDTGVAVEAVTKGMVGQTRALKEYGVVINANDVKERMATISKKGYYESILTNGEKVRINTAKLSEQQLKTVATLDLLQGRSEDAWTAFANGSGAADDALDGLNATLANLKTDAIEGFGRILAGLVGDFMAAEGGAEGFFGGMSSLGDWITANEGRIREFFQSLGVLMLDGASSAIQLGIALTNGFIGSWPAIKQIILGLAQMAAGSQIAVGAMMMLNPLTFSMGKSIYDSVDSTRQLATGFADAGDKAAEFAKQAVPGMEKAKDAIDGWRNKLAGLKTDHQVIELRAKLKQGDYAAVKAGLKSLSADQLAKIQANVTGQSKADKELRKLIKKRIAELAAKTTGAPKVKAELDGVAKMREAPIKPVIVGIGGALGQLSQLTAQRSVKVQAPGPKSLSAEQRVTVTYEQPPRRLQVI